MSIYILLLIIIFILGVKLEKKNKKLYSAIVCILFTIIASLRSYNVGNDTNNYISLFRKILNMTEIYGFEIFKVSRFENRFYSFNDTNEKNHF